MLRTQHMLLHENWAMVESVQLVCQSSNVDGLLFMNNSALGIGRCTTSITFSCTWDEQFCLTAMACLVGGQSLQDASQTVYATPPRPGDSQLRESYLAWVPVQLLAWLSLLTMPVNTLAEFWRAKRASYLLISSGTHLSRFDQILLNSTRCWPHPLILCDWFLSGSFSTHLYLSHWS